MSQKIRTVSLKAQEAFWAVVAKEFPAVKNRDFNPEETREFNEACVAKEFPAVKNRDFNPEETREFNEACEQAIYDWVRENYPSGVERYSLLM